VAAAPDSEAVEPAMEFTPESELDVLELDDAPKLDDVLDLDNTPELDDMPKSEELLVPDSLPLVSEMTVPDSLPSGTFLCARCHLVHEDCDSWNRAHSFLYPCVHCSLVHMDYWLSSPLRRDEFDCTAALDVKHEMEQMQQSWRNMNTK
jgi:hypothetical protein